MVADLPRGTERVTLGEFQRAPAAYFGAALGKYRYIILTRPIVGGGTEDVAVIGPCTTELTESGARKVEASDFRRGPYDRNAAIQVKEAVTKGPAIITLHGLQVAAIWPILAPETTPASEVSTERG